MHILIWSWPLVTFLSSHSFSLSCHVYIYLPFVIHRFILASVLAYLHFLILFSLILSLSYYAHLLLFRFPVMWIFSWSYQMVLYILVCLFSLSLCLSLVYTLICICYPLLFNVFTYSIVLFISFSLCLSVCSMHSYPDVVYFFLFLFSSLTVLFPSLHSIHIFIKSTEFSPLLILIHK